MKIVTAGGKQKIVMTRKEWKAIGKKAGWTKMSQSDVGDSRKILVWSGVKSVTVVDDEDPGDGVSRLKEMAEAVESYMEGISESVGFGSHNTRVYLVAKVQPIPQTLSVQPIQQTSSTELENTPEDLKWRIGCNFDIEVFINFISEKDMDWYVNEAMKSYMADWFSGRDNPDGLA